MQKERYLQVFHSHPIKEYRWINLPDDAKIISVILANHYLDIYYTTKRGTSISSSSEKGFSISLYQVGQKIYTPTATDMKKHESEKVLYEGIIMYNDEPILVQIIRWEKSKK